MVQIRTGLRRCVASALEACGACCLHLMQWCFTRADRLSPSTYILSPDRADVLTESIVARIQAEEGNRPTYHPSKAATACARFADVYNQPAFMVEHTIYLCPAHRQDARPS